MTEDKSQQHRRESKGKEAKNLKVRKRGHIHEERRVSSGPGSRKVSEGLQQLNPDAIRLLRESYTLLDSDGTGSVGRQELQEIAFSLGLRLDKRRLDEMYAQSGEPLVFGGYLGVLAESVSGLARRDEFENILSAFSTPSGEVDTAAVCEAWKSAGLSPAEIERLLCHFGKAGPGGRVLNGRALIDELSI